MSRQNHFLKQKFPTLYKRYIAIRQRCNNPDDVNFKYYGGKGTKCAFSDFYEFAAHLLFDLSWDEERARKEGRKYSIRRLDDNLDYKEGNLWIEKRYDMMVKNFI